MVYLKNLIYLVIASKNNFWRIHRKSFKKKEDGCDGSSIIYWAFLHPWVVEYHLMGSTLGKVSFYFFLFIPRIFASCVQVYLVMCVYSLLQALTSCLLILSCRLVLASCLLLICSAGSCMLSVCFFLPSTLSLPALLFHGFVSLLLFYLLSNLIYCILSCFFMLIFYFVLCLSP